MDAKKFGEYLRSLRKEKKLTLVDLGDRIGYSNPYLSQIETGQKGVPSPKILKKLAEGLEVDYEELAFSAGYIVGSDSEKLGKMIERIPPKVDYKGIIEYSNVGHAAYYDGEKIERSEQNFINGVIKIITESLYDNENKFEEAEFEKFSEVIQVLMEKY